MIEMIATVAIPVTYLVLLGLERLVPARPLPAVKRWTLKGVAFFLMVMVLSGLIPAIVAGASANLSSGLLLSLGTVGGAIVTFLAAELLSYALHRAFHRVDLLWRWVHQLHHSAERLDVAGSAFVSPTEVIIGGVTTTLATMMLGVNADAAALAGFAAVFNAIFQHCNIRTPVWLGYVIQRPESHSVHHARGVHAYNYANFPMIDVLFGTFRNPETFSPVQGFWDGASTRVGSMLIGRDVSQPSARGTGGADASLTMPRPRAWGA